MKLDRTKPFGTVHGSASAFYEQDGKMFDHEGKLIVDAVDEPAPKVGEVEAPVAKKKPGRPPKVDEVDPQLASQLND